MASYQVMRASQKEPSRYATETMFQKASRKSTARSSRKLLPPAKMTDPPMMTSVLNTTEPTTVPEPTSSEGAPRATSEAKSSGEEVPAAMSVAPAMSGGMLRPLASMMMEFLKSSSQITAIATSVSRMPSTYSTAPPCESNAVMHVSSITWKLSGCRPPNPLSAPPPGASHSARYTPTTSPDVRRGPSAPNSTHTPSKPPQ